MSYLYYFANTSLVVRLLTYLHKRVTLPLGAVTVIYLVDRWVVRVQLEKPLPTEQTLDFESFLKENGCTYPASEPAAVQIFTALQALDGGLSIAKVLEQYHVVVVSHGAPQPTSVENFRTSFVKELGYCPPSLV